MNTNDKYNLLVSEISKSQSEKIYPKTFELDFQEFKSIIDAIEYDGLFEKGYWAIGGFYIFVGLTFNGRNFLENNDKKEYHKIEKKEVNYHNSVHVEGDNKGNIVNGDNATISEFDKKFDDLINAINQSNINNKNLIIEELNNKKNKESALKQYLGSLLSRSADVVSVVSAIGAVLSI